MTRQGDGEAVTLPVAEWRRLLDRADQQLAAARAEAARLVGEERARADQATAEAAAARERAARVEAEAQAARERAAAAERERDETRGHLLEVERARAGAEAAAAHWRARVDELAPARQALPSTIGAAAPTPAPVHPPAASSGGLGAVRRWWRAQRGS